MCFVMEEKAVKVEAENSTQATLKLAWCLSSFELHSHNFQL